MKAGIFGFYSYNNFGDDLMALLFARHLRSLNLEIVIYSKSKSLVQYDFEVSGSLKEFVSQVDVVVYGGGGLLIPKKKYFKNIVDLNNDISELISLCSEKEIPIYAISVGGNGLPLKRLKSETGYQLIEASEDYTVRNREDLVSLFEAFGKGKFLHDIVWTAPRFFPTEKSLDNNPRRIGICLYIRRGFFSKSKIIDKLLKQLHQFLLGIFLRLNSKYDYYFINLRSDNLPIFRPLKSRNNFFDKDFSNIESDVRFIQSLDLLITDKLHISVVALSYGIPVINLGKEPKIMLFFRNCSLSRLHWSSPTGPLRLIYHLSSNQKTKKLLKLIEGYDLGPITTSAESNFNELESMLGIEDSAG